MHVKNGASFREKMAEIVCATGAVPPSPFLETIKKGVHLLICNTLPFSSIFKDFV